MQAGIITEAEQPVLCFFIHFFIFFVLCFEEEEEEEDEDEHFFPVRSPGEVGGEYLFCFGS
jgi:hypothetical protein